MLARVDTLALPHGKRVHTSSSLVRERESGRERENERVKKRERERDSICF